MYKLPIIKEPEIFNFELMINFSKGFVANLDETGNSDNAIWIPFNNADTYKKLIGDTELNHNGLFLNVSVGAAHQIKINLTDVPELFQINTKINFLKNISQKTLDINILGFNESHMRLLSNNLGCRPAIKIENINFEQIDITPIFTRNSEFNFDTGKTIGDFIFTCNGLSKFEFETPIYKWLVKNKELISY